MLRFSIILTILLQMSAFSKEKSIGILYLNRIFGHVHAKPDQFSSSLTTMACGHPVTILKSPRGHHAQDWFYVRVGDAKGFVHTNFLSEKKELCFQDKYPKFFNALNLDLNELYYWGRLIDHYVEGESRVE